MIGLALTFYLAAKGAYSRLFDSQMALECYGKGGVA